jgi:TatD DNase family protein
MMFIDTHVHFDSFRDSAGVTEAMDRAAAAGVTKMIAVGGSPEGNQVAFAVAARYQGRVFAAVGFDRDQAKSEWVAGPFVPDLSRSDVVAVGEIGLDYYYHPDTAAVQKKLFGQMLVLAGTHQLPVIVHSREANDDTVALLLEHVRQWRGDPGRIGVLHCFTGSGGFATKLLDLGLMIGFSGIITFKNANDLRAVARDVPEDRLLIETDTPYLAPVPHRGRSNEPAYVAHVAETLSKIRNDTLEHIAHSTARNAETLFGLTRNKDHERR